MMTILPFFYIMLITLQEAEPSDIDVDNASLHDQIVTEVSQIVLEEMSGIIG